MNVNINSINFNHSDLSILKKRLTEYLHDAYKILYQYNSYIKNDKYGGGYDEIAEDIFKTLNVIPLPRDKISDRIDSFIDEIKKTIEEIDKLNENAKVINELHETNKYINTYENVIKIIDKYIAEGNYDVINDHGRKMYLQKKRILRIKLTI